MVLLTDSGIEARRSRYSCCSLDFAFRFVEAKIHGDQKCADDNWSKAMYMDWASFVMRDTPITGDGCTLLPFATEVADTADCYCDLCGCQPVVQSCDIAVNYTVIAAVDADQQATIESAGPYDGDAYYVVTDSGAIDWTVNSIQTWSSGVWVAFDVPNGNVVITEDVPPVYWTVLGNTADPGMLFPTVTITSVGGSDFIVQSDYPEVALYTGRTVLVQGYNDVLMQWITFFSGPEADIALPVTVSLWGFNVQAVRATYELDDCSWISENGSIFPPGCGNPHDHDCADHDVGTDHY